MPAPVRELDEEGPVLVRFWADWCIPCHAMRPMVERIARDHALKLVAVNVEIEAELTARYGVQAVPTVMLFQGGRQRTAVGPMPRARLIQRLGLAG
jgi:thioredoxin 1